MKEEEMSELKFGESQKWKVLAPLGLNSRNGRCSEFATEQRQEVLAEVLGGDR